MNRYSVITEKNPREVVLLRGGGCKWRKCRFCDYHLDRSDNEEENFALNAAELKKVEGLYGALEVLNSGSFCDLDEKSVREVIQTCGRNNIRRLHIECHWQDRSTLPEIRRRFALQGIQITVKMGVETFDACFRDETLNKGMEHASPETIAKYADEVCLLFGLPGQNEKTMTADIKTGLRFFKRVCINLMTENTTAIKPDSNVFEVFFQNIYPLYKENERVDILLENTDFGVGGTEHDK